MKKQWHLLISYSMTLLFFFFNIKNGILFYFKCIYILAYNIYYIVNSCVFYEGHKFISLWLLGATLFK